MAGDNNMSAPDAQANEAVLKNDEFLEGEQSAIGKIMLDLSAGKLNALADFLARGKSISAAASYFLGVIMRQEKIGDYTPRRLERISRRGRPKTDSGARAINAALWVHWTVNKLNPERRNPKREEAIAQASRRHHVDSKEVRAELAFFERFGFAPTHPRILRKDFKAAIPPLVNSVSSLKSDTSEK